eukprot:770566-Amphidinium_carterae.1
MGAVEAAASQWKLLGTGARAGVAATACMSSLAACYLYVRLQRGRDAFLYFWLGDRAPVLVAALILAL